MYIIFLCKFSLLEMYIVLLFTKEAVQLCSTKFVLRNPGIYLHFLSEVKNWDGTDSSNTSFLHTCNIHCPEFGGPIL